MSSTYTLLVVTVFVYITAPVFCSVYNGRGSFYFTYNDRHDRSQGVRVVYRPENPHEYAKAELSTYLAFTVNKGGDPSGTANNLTSSKYAGWKLMSWEPYGLYYYTDHVQTTQVGNYEYFLIVYGADIFSGKGLVYSDEYRYLYTTSYSPYCILDRMQNSSTEYKCSEALGWDAWQTTTYTSQSTKGDDTATTNNSGAAALIGFLTLSVLLVLVIALIACISRHTASRKPWTRTSSLSVQGTAQTVDQSNDRSHDRSHDTTHLPPPYTIAIQSSPPDKANVLRNPNSYEPKNILEQLPSYDLATSNFTKEQLHGHCTHVTVTQPMG